MENTDNIYDLIHKTFFENNFQNVIELWESNNIPIDFSNEKHCFIFSFVIDSYNKLGDINSAIKLSLHEIKTCKKSSIIPNNIELTIIDLIHFYYQKDKKIKAYKSILLLKDFKKDIPEKLSEPYNFLDNYYYNKIYTPIVEIVYPVCFVTIIILQKNFITIFENKGAFLAFLIINISIFIFLGIIRVKKIKLLKEIFRETIRWFVKLK